MTDRALSGAEQFRAQQLARLADDAELILGQRNLIAELRRDTTAQLEELRAELEQVRADLRRLNQPDPPVPAGPHHRGPDGRPIVRSSSGAPERWVGWRQA